MQAKSQLWELLDCFFYLLIKPTENWKVTEVDEVMSKSCYFDDGEEVFIETGFLFCHFEHSYKNFS